MEITPFDRLVIRPDEIYCQLVRAGVNGTYHYYTRPWIEKITFSLPSHVIKSHDEGNLKTLTLLEAESGEWSFHTYERYTMPNRKLPKKIYKLLNKDLWQGNGW